MKYFYFLVFLVSITSFAQERNEHKMRLMITDVSIFPLKVINVTTKEVVSTDAGGYFTINVQPNDELALIENEFYQLKYFMKKEDLQNTVIRIYPEPLTEVLREIEVEKITSKSLGIDAAEINKYIYKRNPNPNMDFKAMFLWLLGKMKKNKGEEFVERRPTDMNPYVAGLPRSVMTDYLKIPDELVEKFYYYLNDDYVIDQYIKSGDEAKWRMHLLDKSFQFLEQENIPLR
ncbi:hypothetical protein SAMN05421741_11948 [Paenimyroides ummariense]|uniref:CarboxypepD_reg-like domain-containing protein n=1 Tax=Paenimyroides ummariense TaxID=913024 RepID=A0A1I5EAB4_9FLAO|nr:hypothetical protein [Paenimyroides ummariense]SFO08196.1 hypothetical protein SAMN05421741_11948 [Paenimyroides ummariense]